MDPIFESLGNYFKNSTSWDPQNPYPNEHSARLRDPGDFKEKPDWSTGGKFRRTAGGVIYGSKRVPTTIGIIWGQLKTQSGQAAAPQALRFPIRNWTEAAARKWLKDNSITFIRFEPAAPKKDQAPENAYNCQCIKCGYKVTSDKHCNTFKCPKCGGTMRRAERPGPGQDEGPRQSWYDIQDRNDGTADIYIYDEIGGWGIEAKEFIKEFNALKASKVNIHINSPGGSVFEGWAIYNAINNNSKGKIVNTFIEGIAASMASVIALAGDYINMSENSLFMIHNPIGGARGEVKDLEKVIEILNKIKDSIVNIYHKKTGIEADEIKKMMDAETWFTAQEALDAGFIDKITEQLAAAATFDLSKYDYRDKLKYGELIKNFNQKQTQNPGGQTMDNLTLEILKAQYPDIYDQVKAEVKKGFYDEGHAAGVTEGTTAGATAERERIQAIESIQIKGAEAIVNEEKFKPEATKESVSALILEKQKAGELKLNNALDTDAAEAAAAAAKIDGQPTGDDEAEEAAAAAEIAAGSKPVGVE